MHFSSDSYIPVEFKKCAWIEAAIEQMEKDRNVVVANPVWNYRYDEAKDESLCESEDGNFYMGYGFSDQCYLINTEFFKAPIYSFHHPDSDRYPRYGGELFEKRVDAYMRVNEKKRLTAKNVSYISKNNRIWSYFLEKTGIKNIGG